MVISILQLQTAGYLNRLLTANKDDVTNLVVMRKEAQVHIARQRQNGAQSHGDLRVALQDKVERRRQNVDALAADGVMKVGVGHPDLVLP